MTPRWWLPVLKLCVSVTLIARGWLTWRWDSPIRGLIWNEKWWSGVVDDWTQFATHSDALISRTLMAIGLVMILGGAVIPWLTSRIPWTRWLLIPLAGLLAIDGAARWVDTGYELGMGIEYSLQIITPIALFLAIAFPTHIQKWSRIIAVAAALTFIGHGLYAIGFHPVPLGYQTMTMKILSVTQETALTFLTIARWLDFVAAVCLFIRPLRKLSLYYMIVWGFLTALSRIVANGDPDPWLFETIVRTSHWVLPLLLLILLAKVRLNPVESLSKEG